MSGQVRILDDGTNVVWQREVERRVATGEPVYKIAAGLGVTPAAIGHRLRTWGWTYSKLRGWRKEDAIETG